MPTIGSSTTRFEPETRVERDYGAIARNRMRRAFPELDDEEVRAVERAYGNIAGRPGFIAEMQEKPFEERFLGGIQRNFARPLRQHAGPSIQEWNALASQLAKEHAAFAELTLRYGSKQDGIMIYDLMARIAELSGDT